MSVSQEKFKEMLKDKGLKVTNQRLLVLEVLASNREKHMVMGGYLRVSAKRLSGDRVGDNLPNRTVVIRNAVGGSDQSG